MIKNKNQYKLAKRKIRRLSKEIDRVIKEPADNPLKTHILVSCLNYLKNEIENDLLFYESLHNNS